MTKAKARQRAKAKAGQKAKKRAAAAAEQADQSIPPGQFNPGPGSIKAPKMNTNTKNFAEAKRGAARSR